MIATAKFWFFITSCCPFSFKYGSTLWRFDRLWNTKVDCYCQNFGILLLLDFHFLLSMGAHCEDLIDCEILMIHCLHGVLIYRSIKCSSWNTETAYKKSITSVCWVDLISRFTDTESERTPCNILNWHISHSLNSTGYKAC